MKKPKGKKSGIKNQNKKSLARYQTTWVKSPKGYNKALIVEKPNAIPSAPDAELKESTKALKAGFPNAYEDIRIPEPVLDKRKRAEVIPIRGQPKLHGVTSPTKEELDDQIAKLEAHINASSTNEEGAFVGPPKPELSAANDTSSVEVTGKTTHENVHELVPKYGSLIKDVGEGMTPSGQTISSFREGTWKPTSWVVQPESKLHSVTSNDYTYEELAELYDMQQVEHLEKIASYESRIRYYQELLSLHEKDRYDSKDQRRVAEFTAASKGYETEDDLRYQIDRASAYIKELQQELSIEQRKSGSSEQEVAIIELQEENSYLTLENQEQRKALDDMSKEMDLLMYTIDQYSKNTASEKISNAKLTTLANQFHIYMSQHKDDPLRNFFRYSNYSISQLGVLRNYFDRECEGRIKVSEERRAYRKWANRATYKVGKGLRILNEIKAIRSIGINAAVLRKVEIPDGHCKKLAKVTQCNTDVGAKNVYDKRFRPLTSGIDHDAYCKVWTELTYVMPRQEFDDWRKQVAKEKLYNEVSKTTLFKVVKPIVTAKRAIGKVLNYELSPKKRKEAERIAKLEEKKTLEHASSIKRMREEQFENEINKEVLRRRQLGLPDNV